MARRSNTAPNKMSPDSDTRILFLFSPHFVCTVCHFSFRPECRFFFLSRLCSFLSRMHFLILSQRLFAYFVPFLFFFLYRCVFFFFFFVPETPLRFPAQRRITTWGFRGVRVGEASRPGAARRHMSRPIEGRDVTTRLHPRWTMTAMSHVPRCKGGSGEGSQSTVIPRWSREAAGLRL